VVVSRETESRMPTAARLTTSEVPPELMKGSVIPVTGMRLTTTAMFRKAWTHRTTVTPAARSIPKRSGACVATRSPRYPRRRKRPMTRRPPTSPNSWPTIAKM